MNRKRTVAGLVLLTLVACGWMIDREERNRRSADRLAKLIDLREGQTVADLGAGEGPWTVQLSRLVGETGRVLATEVDEGVMKKLKRTIRKKKLSNVETILGDQASTGLPAACCHTIHIRLVYHHFEQPKLMLEDLSRALKPGGTIAVIDFGPDNNFSTNNVPKFRNGHGVEAAQVIREMEEAGFETIEHIDEWEKRNYLLVFRRRD